MSEGKHILVTKGGGKLDTTKKKPQEWTQLLCSQSDNGCGAVFWARKDAGEHVHDDDRRCRVDYGWQTPCPVCTKLVGGYDTKFILLTEPPTCG